MDYYRYQSINKLTLQNLANQKNWIADPYKFNDPFEFSIMDGSYINEDGKIIYLKGEEYDKLKNLESMVRDFGVICYSKEGHNNLLWAHYAENHQGMCLVFDIPEKEKLYKVNYSDLFPKIDLSHDSKKHEEMIKIVTTKSSEWAYEKEYRQVYITKNELYEYPGKLVEIVFGCKASIDDINMVTRIAKSNDGNVIISKMFCQPNMYKLGKSTLMNTEDIPKFWKNDY